MDQTGNKEMKGGAMGAKAVENGRDELLDQELAKEEEIQKRKQEESREQLENLQREVDEAKREAERERLERERLQKMIDEREGQLRCEGGGDKCAGCTKRDERIEEYERGATVLRRYRRALEGADEGRAIAFEGIYGEGQARYMVQPGDPLHWTTNCQQCPKPRELGSMWRDCPEGWRTLLCMNPREWLEIQAVRRKEGNELNMITLRRKIKELKNFPSQWKIKEVIEPKDFEDFDRAFCTHAHYARNGKEGGLSIGCLYPGTIASGLQESTRRES
ncbi:hypothetical protein PMAYCL1PPCAC_29306 [Pristionchus mayeri]|uniref:Uncharacterized protein n=1 Tax=Pristionchus mayeri TaxID=1317129 RepID=A0AAN5D9U8_9BILA|nr:hypothetical protein PMAYCL1PPCAC_29306 [Pristionchus mayeri]